MVITTAPDIGEVGVKFVIGIILISLFWPVWFGAERLWFIYHTSTLKQVSPLPVDLSKIKGVPSGGYRGYLEITGYPRVQIAVDSSGPVYMENLAEAVKTYRSFYFSLHSKNSSSSASVIVERKESFITNLFGYFPKSTQEKFPSPPENDKPFTVTGVAGYYVSGISKDLRQYFEARGIDVSPEAILLKEGAPPALKFTLLWFIPILLLFILGIYLLGNAIYWIPKVVL